MSHIFECEETKEYLDKLGINVGILRVYGVKSLLGNHYLWSDHKKRSSLLADFSAVSFFIAEIIRCQLHGDKLSWSRTRFKLVSYISYLLGSDNVKYNILGKELKEMLNIGWRTVLTKALTQLTIHFLNNLYLF